MVKGIHHINFLVRDLDAAITRYEQILGIPVTAVEALPRRNVNTARFRVGQSWLVLVQPTGEGVPADHLNEHGEGFFLMSFEVDDLDATRERLSEAGLNLDASRRGVANWTIADLDTAQSFNALLQFTEELSDPED